MLVNIAGIWKPKGDREHNIPRDTVSTGLELHEYLPFPKDREGDIACFKGLYLEEHA